MSLNKTGLLITLSFSIVVTFLMFYNQILFPGDYLFSSVYDGIKNYYAIKTYILQSSEIPYSYYSYLNYPFGESIVFPDISPSLAIPLRWLYLHYNINVDVLICFYNYFFIIQIALASSIVYLILKRLNFSVVQSIALSIIITFTQGQLLKLAGHFNLSSFFSIALCLYLCLKFKEYYENEKFSKAYSIIYSLIIIILFYSFVHVYYFIILLPFALIFLGLLGISLILNRKIGKYYFIHSALLAIIPTLFINSIIKYTNPNPEYHRLIQVGYNWDFWTLQFYDLYRPYSFLNSIKIFRPQDQYMLERFGFIGNINLIAIFTSVILLILLCIKKLINKISVVSTQINSNVILFFLSGIIMLIMSLGSTLNAEDGSMVIKNFINPLNYLDNIFIDITQFRCLGRLSYPFYVCFTISIFYVIKILFIKLGLNKIISNGILIFILIFGFIDTYDYIIFVKENFNRENIINKRSISSQPIFSNNIYQAILPIPYFHSGSHELGLTIDDNDEWSKEIYKLSLKNKLPLMACKTARTPDTTAIMQFKMFLDFKMDSSIRKRMNNKKILVAYKPDVIQNSNYEPAQTVLSNSSEFITRMKLDYILEKDGIKYYSWNLNQ